MWAWTSSTIGGNSSEPLLEGLIINDLDLMLCQIGTAQLSRLQRKDVMIFHQETVCSSLILSRPPLQPSCWKNASFLCPVNILTLWTPCISPSFSNVPNTTSTLGTVFAATTQLNLMPLTMVIGVTVQFFTMTTTCLLPVVISV